MSQFILLLNVCLWQGITHYAYVPPSLPVKSSDWPTLSEMIDSGKRLVVFLDYGANTSEANFILPEFDMVCFPFSLHVSSYPEALTRDIQQIWETPFSITDPRFPCKVDRITGPLATGDHMYMINHSLNINVFNAGIVVSDPKDAPTTNSVTSQVFDPTH